MRKPMSLSILLPAAIAVAALAIISSARCTRSSRAAAPDAHGCASGHACASHATSAAPDGAEVAPAAVTAAGVAVLTAPQPEPVETPPAAFTLVPVGSFAGEVEASMTFEVDGGRGRLVVTLRPAAGWKWNDIAPTPTVTVTPPAWLALGAEFAALEGPSRQDAPSGTLVFAADAALSQAAAGRGAVRVVAYPCSADGEICVRSEREYSFDHPTQ